VNTKPGEPIVLFYSPAVFQRMYDEWMEQYLKDADTYGEEVWGGGQATFLPEQEVLGMGEDFTH